MDKDQKPPELTRKEYMRRLMVDRANKRNLSDQHDVPVVFQSGAFTYIPIEAFVGGYEGYLWTRMTGTAPDFIATESVFLRAAADIMDVYRAFKQLDAGRQAPDASP